MSKEVAAQVVDMSIKATPPLAVTGLSIYGVALPDVVSVLTIAYLAVHIGYILYKWYKGK